MRKLPKLNSFRGRVLVLLIALVTMAQLSTYAVVRSATERNVERRLRQELRVGVEVFQSVLGARGQQLLGSARLLADDHGFRVAVASENNAAIRLALSKHRARSNADALLLITLDGQITASTLSDPDESMFFPVPGLLRLAAKDGEASGIGLIGERPYQLVLTPLSDLRPIAWVALGFLIDQELATHLHSLTGLEVSFVARGSAAPFIASSLDLGPNQRIARKLLRAAQQPGSSIISLNSEPYSNLTRSLSGDSDDQLQLLLQTSLHEALAPFDGMRWQLLAVTVVALLVSVGAAAALVSNVTRPISLLLRVTQRVRRGEYGYPLRLLDHEEFDALASALNLMQDDIAEREARLKIQAGDDRCVELANFTLASDRLERALARARRRGESLVLCLFHLTQISDINDTLGHELDDEVLRQVAHRLRAFLRESDTLAHLEGDELLVLLEGTEGAEAEIISAALRLTMQQPLESRASVLRLDASVGMAVYPRDGSGVATLMHRARHALGEAKHCQSGLCNLPLPGEPASTRESPLPHPRRA
jgi:diguanylate cyclase (GGDEF)-like protein